MNKKPTQIILAGGLAAALAVLTACSSTPSESTNGSGNGDSATPASGPVYMDHETGECAAPPLEGVDLDAAIETLREYQEPPTELVFSTPLPEAPSPDTQVVYLNNDSQVAGIMQENLERAAAAAGVQFTNVSTGVDAQSINAALNSVVEMEPDIVVAVALDATFYIDQIVALQEQGASIVYASVPNADEFGLDDSLSGAGASAMNGRALISSAIAFTCGTVEDIVFYHVPEFGFSQLRLEAAEKRLEEIAPNVNLRVVDISIMDPSPADKIISDLQAHPETEFFVTPADQFQVGLAEKARLAGIDNAIGLGQSSVPANFQQILDGEQFAGFAEDFGMFMWQLLDEGLRKQQGVFEPYDDWTKVNKTVGQMITVANAQQYNTPDGFVPFPEYQDEFKKMWNTQ